MALIKIIYQFVSQASIIKEPKKGLKSCKKKKPSYKPNLIAFARLVSEIQAQTASTVQPYPMTQHLFIYLPHSRWQVIERLTTFVAAFTACVDDT